MNLYHTAAIFPGSAASMQSGMEYQKQQKPSHRIGKRIEFHSSDLACFSPFQLSTSKIINKERQTAIVTNAVTNATLMKSARVIL
jgi:hypothetical protein